MRLHLHRLTKHWPAARVVLELHSDSGQDGENAKEDRCQTAGGRTMECVSATKSTELIMIAKTTITENALAAMELSGSSIKM